MRTETVEIERVEFWGSALRPEDRPKEWFPQIAVAGRSNVGKSSLLNWLWRRRLARVAKSPGKTRTLNYYLVNGSVYFVDLPGYGYAAVNRDLKRQWSAELSRYLMEEPRLAGVVSLLDIRHGPTRLDHELHRLLAGSERESLVVLTKADTLGRGRRQQQRFAVQRQLGLATPPLAVSVRTGEGRRELLAALDGMIERWKTLQRGA